MSGGGGRQKLGSLPRSSQRDFIKDDLPGAWPQLSSNSFPANVDLTSAQLTALNNFVRQSNDRHVARHQRRTAPNPESPTAVRGVSTSRALRARAATTNSVAPTGPRRPRRMQLQLHGRHRNLSGIGEEELCGSAHRSSCPAITRCLSRAVERNQDRLCGSACNLRNISAATGISSRLLQAVAGVTTPVAFRFRLTDAGNRTSRVESTSTRVVAGAQRFVQRVGLRCRHQSKRERSDRMKPEGMVSRTDAQRALSAVPTTRSRCRCRRAFMHRSS